MKSKNHINYDVGIHNRFDVFRKNIETGKEEQIGFAENIILNSMWSRICNRQGYFANIHYGTGTGILDPTRTTLFTHKGTKVATTTQAVRDIPISSWRRMIVLNPEDEVGTVLSEVGIAYGATNTNLVTHALLQDMNGNPVTITKTAVDLITIYATVYVQLTTTNAEVGIIGLPNSNALLNFLTSESSMYDGVFWKTGRSDIPVHKFQKFQVSSEPSDAYGALGTTATASKWVADLANKRIYTPLARFAVGESNGHIKEIVMVDNNTGGGYQGAFFRYVLPATGIYSGLELAGVSVGTGDGVTKKFILPSDNIKQDSIVIKADGVTVTNYTKSAYTNKISCRLASNSYGYPTTSGRVAISGDGKVIASSNVATYDFDKGIFQARPSPVGLPTGGALGVALNYDGSILAFAHANSPFITIHDWTDGAWVKRANPASLPSGQCNDCFLSSNGLILAVAMNTSPYIATYDWTDGAWIKRNDPATPPTGIARTCVMTSDGSILAVAHSTSPYISTYDWTDGAWVKRANPASPPTNTGYGCAFSADGSVLAVGSSASPYLWVYDWSGGVWAKRANVSGLAATSHEPYVGLSSDGNTASISYYYSGSNPGFYVCDWADGAWTVRSSYGTLGSGNYVYSCISPDDNYLISSGSYFFVYDISKRQTMIEFDIAPAVGAVITGDYTVNGIHKTTTRVIDLSASITFGEYTP